MATAAAAAYAPFRDLNIGNIYDIIALVDSRHDFRKFAQDFVKRFRTFENAPDFVSNFSANIQRIVLGYDPEYSRRFTSNCIGDDILGTGPELSFLNAVIRIFNPELGIIRQPTNDSEYDRYHNEIYTFLSRPRLFTPIQKQGKNVIPIIVDTCRTLTHSSSGNYFAVCRNRECYSDPSKTTLFPFPSVLKEKAGQPPRRYTINNIIYTVGGAVASPQITYTIRGENFRYDFGSKGHKPNEIEICKNNIKEAIKPINEYNVRKMNPSRVQQLIRFYNRYCSDYGSIEYSDDKHNMNLVALPYIAKRAGDQLQVLSCRQSIYYEEFTAPIQCVFWTIDRVAAAFAIMLGIPVVLQLPLKNAEIYLPNRAFLETLTIRLNQMLNPPAIGGNICTRQMFDTHKFGLVDTNCFLKLFLELCNPYSDIYDPFTLLDVINYTIFRTENIVDDIFLNENNVLVNHNEVFPNTGTKYPHSIIISLYINGHIHIIRKTPEGFNMEYSIQGRGSQSIDINAIITELIYVDGQYFNYIIKTRSNANNVMAALPAALPATMSSEINMTNVNNKSIVRTIRNYNGTEYHFMLNGSLVNPTSGLVEAIIHDNGVLHNPINNDPIQQTVNGLNYYVRLIDNQIYLLGPDMKYYLPTPSGNLVRQGGRRQRKARKMNGGGNNFYKEWEETLVTSKLKESIFINFIKLLSICENQYFIHRDSADNFYTYNSKCQLRYGGHTQNELMAFISSLIIVYKQCKKDNSSNKIKEFIFLFSYFPIILKSITKLNNEYIITELESYIGSWFNHNNFFTKLISQAPNFTQNVRRINMANFQKVLTLITETYERNMNDIHKIIENKNEDEYLDYLHKIYPHGYFVREYNEIAVSDNGREFNLKNTKISSSSKVFPVGPTFTSLIRPVAVSGGRTMTRKTKHPKYYLPNKRSTQRAVERKLTRVNA